MVFWEKNNINIHLEGTWSVETINCSQNMMIMMKADQMPAARSQGMRKRHSGEGWWEAATRTTWNHFCKGKGHTEREAEEKMASAAFSQQEDSFLATKLVLVIIARLKTDHCRQFVGCLTSQQHTSVSQRQICSDSFTCCHTETEVADPTFYPTQSQYTNTGPNSPTTDPITPGAWQGSHWSANLQVTGMTDSTRKNPVTSGTQPRIFCSQGGCLNH